MVVVSGCGATVGGSGRGAMVDVSGCGAMVGDNGRGGVVWFSCDGAFGTWHACPVIQWVAFFPSRLPAVLVRRPYGQRSSFREPQLRTQLYPTEVERAGRDSGRPGRCNGHILCRGGINDELFVGSMVGFGVRMYPQSGLVCGEVQWFIGARFVDNGRGCQA